jgi:hypothetical protein
LKNKGFSVSTCLSCESWAKVHAVVASYEMASGQRTTVEELCRTQPSRLSLRSTGIAFGDTCASPVGM